MKYFLSLILLISVSSPAFSRTTIYTVRKETAKQPRLLTVNNDLSAGNGESEVYITWQIDTKNKNKFPLAVTLDNAVTRGRLVAQVDPGQTVKIIVKNGLNTFHIKTSVYDPGSNSWVVIEFGSWSWSSKLIPLLLENNKFMGTPIICNANYNKIEIIIKHNDKNVYSIYPDIIRKASLAGHNRIANSSAVSSNQIEATSSVVRYSVSVDGKPTGPFTIDELRQMAQKGQLLKDTFVWKEGMSQWATAGSIEELSTVWSSVPPPLPPR
jgi:hypothetical protein